MMSLDQLLGHWGILREGEEVKFMWALGKDGTFERILTEEFEFLDVGPTHGKMSDAVNIKRSEVTTPFPSIEFVRPGSTLIVLGHVLKARSNS